MSHKYVKSFRIKNKSRTQIYRFILLNIYWIHNTFYVSLLKLYLHRVDDE